MERRVTVDYGTRTTVTLAGELDVICVPVLGSLLSRVAPRARELVVDVSEVTFIDCAGINALLAARRRMEARGGSLILQDVPPLVRRVIEVAGASLPVAPTAP
jgi:anti-sigma B factor antagonist